MTFERGTPRAIRAGASSRASALLTAVDAEPKPLRCGKRREWMIRRSRPLSAPRLTRDCWTRARKVADRSRWTRNSA